MYYDKNKVQNFGSVTVSGTTEVVKEVDEVQYLRRIYGIVTTATTVGSSTVTLALRDTDDTPTANIGSFVVPSGLAIGAVVYADVGARQTGPTTATDGSTVFDGGDGEIKAVPGQEWVLTPTANGGAGAVNFYLEYVPGGVEIFNAGHTPVKLTYTPA